MKKTKVLIGFDDQPIKSLGNWINFTILLLPLRLLSYHTSTTNYFNTCKNNFSHPDCSPAQTARAMG